MYEAFISKVEVKARGGVDRPSSRSGIGQLMLSERESAHPSVVTHVVRTVYSPHFISK